MDDNQPNLQYFYKKYGPPGVNELAKRIGKPVGYLRGCIFGDGKKPSLSMALLIEKHTGGEVTLAGLNNPTSMPVMQGRYPKMPDSLG